ncbi:methyltransferase domain-containing protein [Bradyrhizobium genosp. L]|uniref:class I SAM-dependent methyltransferase n=1 Tax=Bradyrhizobium genosp. L TaxID=83637 RepID=UPI0018A26F89|nr:class I SAM-dependent methyltransferase [Bradyrhizobium genosp. L]QPF82999.1 methyltransferase domain-containing protein [Bradyrhizobium genosp. L]
MTEGTHPEILQQVAVYYASRLAQHGPTPQGVDWNGRSSHELRHRQFLRLLDDAPNGSLIDLGCGFGDFWRFLRDAGYEGAFTGYDVAASMIDKARELYGENERCRWRVGAEPAEPADFAVASGIFNVKGAVAAERWAGYVSDTIDVLARAGRRGFAFNMLSLSSDPERRRADLYYGDPVAILRDCLARFGRSVALLQDYGLYEFTVIVRHPGV